MWSISHILTSQAAGVLSRLNSDDHSKGQKYFWWQIVGQWMLSSSTDVVDERIRGLSKELAKRMLLKALESTSKGHVCSDKISSRPLRRLTLCIRLAKIVKVFFNMASSICLP